MKRYDGNTPEGIKINFRKTMDERINIRLTYDDYSFLRRLSDNDDRKLSEYCRKILKKHIEENKK